MVLLYRRAMPWTNAEYVKFKNELNAVGVKITPIRDARLYEGGWAHERIRVKYSTDERVYAKRILQVHCILYKYFCHWTELL